MLVFKFTYSPLALEWAWRLGKRPSLVISAGQLDLNINDWHMVQKQVTRVN